MGEMGHQNARPAAIRVLDHMERTGHGFRTARTAARP
jgi:hypothetical protein